MLRFFYHLLFCRRDDWHMTLTYRVRFYGTERLFICKHCGARFWFLA